MAELLEYLNRAVEEKASDLFIITGAPVCVKKEKRIVPLEEGKVLPDRSEALVKAIYALAGRDVRHLEQGDDDFALSVSRLGRFRVNAYHQRGSLATVIRVVPNQIPDWSGIGVPKEVMDLAEETSGLVLFTGTAGSGKSTTQACIIDRINQTRECHIVTLEDPIEYLHRNAKSIVSQREIGIDTEDYMAALRASLRQAPDVILLGEMRDQETIRAALTAAETGHLVMATLHTRGAVETITRIVDMFPVGQQEQVQVQLSMGLRSVVSQQLLPSVDGELVPAFEVMRMNPAIRNYILKKEQIIQINNVIADGLSREGKEKMLPMDTSILQLYKAGRISKDTAMDVAYNPDNLRRRL